MTPKPSPAVDPLTPETPSLTESMPTPAAPAPTPAPATLRCIQRPTGEWFTFAAANPRGKDTPDATELFTEAGARERLQSLSLPTSAIDARIAAARANAEVSGEELPLPDPVVGGGSPGAQ